MILMRSGQAAAQSIEDVRELRPQRPSGDPAAAAIVS
jgi:hypothetical protein